MAKWPQADKIGNGERVGRRLFDEPMLSGAAGQKSFGGIKLYHFEQNAPEISLDRLGPSNDTQLAAREYLLPRAHADAKKFHKQKRFDGWAYVCVKELTTARNQEPSLSVVPSPLEGESPEDNKYHAHLLRPDTKTNYQMALHLRNLFVTHGGIEPSTNAQQQLEASAAANSEQNLNDIYAPNEPLRAQVPVAMDIPRPTASETVGRLPTSGLRLYYEGLMALLSRWFGRTR